METNSNILDVIKSKGDKCMTDFDAQQTTNFESKYTLGAKLGEGGHASVYKCFLKSDKDMNTPFAVKIMRDPDEEKR